MEAIAHYIDGSVIFNFVNATSWLWPAMEIIHFIGLTLMLGALIITDLRLCGFFSDINIRASHLLLPWIFIGFAMNLVTGILFFCGDPMRYSPHLGFKVKMILILFAGINALWYLIKLQPLVDKLKPGSEPPVIVKTVATISLISWLSVLLLGRLIPYVSTG